MSEGELTWPPAPDPDTGGPTVLRCTMCDARMDPTAVGMDAVCAGCWEVLTAKLDVTTHLQGALFAASESAGTLDMELGRAEAAVLCAILREYVQLRLSRCAEEGVQVHSNRHEKASLRAVVAYRIVNELEGELTDEDFKAGGV